MLKRIPHLLDDTVARWWSKFFCLSVYITMYLNDHQRAHFYESLGLNTTVFDMHVIIETNKTTQRIFPEVADVENPQFKAHLDSMLVLQSKLLAIGASTQPEFVKNLQKVPVLAGFAVELLGLWFMPGIKGGSVDYEPNGGQQLVY